MHGQTYDYEACASVTGSCVATVSNTVKTYCTDGLERLLVIDRNVNSDNARRKVDGRVEAKIIEIACRPVPDGIVAGQYGFWKKKLVLYLILR